MRDEGAPILYYICCMYDNEEKEYLMNSPRSVMSTFGIRSGSLLAY